MASGRAAVGQLVGRHAVGGLASFGPALAELAAVPAADWAAYLADDSVRLSLLDAVARYGAGLLRGVPAAARAW